MPDVVRRTKIVATLGPASSSPEMVGRLIDAGVNVFRLNFSHGTQEGHGESVRVIRRAAAERARHVAILQDLQGPKIRVGALTGGGPVELVAGAEVIITTACVVGTARKISTTYEALPRDIRPGDPILLDDGKLQLRAIRSVGEEVTAEVVVGGMLAEHKGINLPGTPLSAPCLTEKDLCDLRFGVKAGVDFMGLSFVRRPRDIEETRREIHSAGGDIPIIAKIERVEAVENLEEIIGAADGVMVARGDLGVETSAEDVPIIQKRILAMAGYYCKPDITATQMLETMVGNLQPSRAEATDVANAVFDGTDAVMLSAETAIGKYPIEAVRTMGRIAVMAERHLQEFGRRVDSKAPPRRQTVAEATVHAACDAARDVGAAAIAVFTLSGRTAFLVSARRPAVPIIAFSPNEAACRRLALAWGVIPVQAELVSTPEQLVAMQARRIRESNLAPVGSLVVMVAGATAVPGATNIVKIHRVDGAE